VYLRPQPQRTLIERIYRLGEGVIALKELDFFTSTRSGPVRERRAALIDAVLSDMEKRHDLQARGAGTPERAKAVRQAVIKKLEDETNPVAMNGDLRQLQQDLEDVFFVMQLYSYPGDYLPPQSSIERVAETIDKFEEDILGLDLPSVRGRRRVVVKFGEPVEVAAVEGKKPSSAQLTLTLQQHVQQLIDEINQANPSQPCAV
jgi:hypothetical protein